LVEVRTKLINHVRGTVKAYGARLPGCSAAAFANKMAELIPEGLQGALLEVVDEIGQLSVRIGRYDRRITRLAQESYPESKLLQQVPGVGALTALSYILVLGDRRRFARSRQVGAYLGLVPRQQQSGERSPELHITRAGDAALRRLLVQGAHYIMGPFGPDTQLRRWGLKMAGEGSSARKKRAIVAVARKLAVLLHRLWTTAEVYEPFHGEGRVVVAA
jgi:transposase